MKNYSVSFYHTGEKEEFLGSVVVDDHGTSAGYTIQAKAFRHASPKCVLANKVLVSEIRGDSTGHRSSPK